MKTKLLFSFISFLISNITLAKSEIGSLINNTTDPAVVITASNSTICPGNSTTISITGTPLSILTVRDNNDFIFTLSISASGTGTFVTPILYETTTYTVIEIREIATNIVTPVSNTSVTINVISNGCFSINVDVENDNPFICNIGECVILAATPTPMASTTSYQVSSIPYCPQVPFNDPNFVQFPLTTDDTYSPIFPLPFNFNFYGNNFSTVQIGDNGVISFGTNYPPNVYGQNAYIQNLPFSSSNFPNSTNSGADAPFRNIICGVFQDTNALENPPVGLTKSVNYQVIGQYPCRKLIVNFNLGQYNCGYSNGEQSSQIVLYEISNIIEVYVKNRTPCNAHQGGRGVIGIKGSGANPSYAIAPGRDSGNWTTSNEAWRFTPNGPEVPYTFQWLENGTPISTDFNISVCPSESKTYTANINYNLNGNSFNINSNNVVIQTRDYEIQNPVDLTVCNNSESIYTVDLTANDSVILGSLESANFEIDYFTNLNDAINLSNPISNPFSYSFSQNETIFVNIFDLTSGCTNTKSFNLVILENVAPPTGETVQLFVAGQTLNDLIITGSNIIWYDAPEGGNQLPGTTPVQDNTTYYASQTVGGCESRRAAPQRLAILVTSSLDANTFVLNNITLSPNPFNDFVSFDFKNSKGILEIFTILGQKMNSFKLKNGHNTINLNSISSGIYFFKITSENKSKTFKLLKK